MALGADEYVWLVKFSVYEPDEDTGGVRLDGPYTWAMRSNRQDTSVDDVKQAVVDEHVSSGYDHVLADFIWHTIDHTRVIWF